MTATTPIIIRTIAIETTIMTPRIGRNLKIYLDVRIKGKTALIKTRLYLLKLKLEKEKKLLVFEIVPDHFIRIYQGGKRDFGMDKLKENY